MKPILLIIELNADEEGKISLTKERLQEIIDEAYNEGYKDGKSDQATSPYTPLPPIQVPTYPQNPYPSTPFWWTSPTCGSGSTCSKENNVSISSTKI